jgi:uncharacterized protein YhaN
VHRIRGLEWVGDLDRGTLLRVAAVGALVTLAGVALAIAVQSIIALVVALLAAVVVLGVVAEMTPSPAERSPIPVPLIPASTRPVSARASRSGPAPRSTESSMMDDLDRLYQAALTRLAAALIERGRRAHPFTAVADYDRYVLDCQEAAQLRAQADREFRERRARDQAALDAREAAAQQAERIAEELEQEADEYDLSLPYRQSVVEAERELATAERDLEAATAAMGGIDARIRTLPSPDEIEAGLARATAAVDRAERLDRVLLRAHTELTLAREAVLRDVASGLTPRLTDYLAQFTDRPYSTVDTHNLADQIGTSLLRREPLLGSFSTSETTFLFTRIALGQHLAGDATQGPLLVDDITASADTERIRRLLAIMRRIAAQRQVVVFAHQSQVRNWAHNQIGKDPGVRLIRLTSIAEDPKLVPPPLRATREARPKRPPVAATKVIKQRPGA